MDLSKDSGIWRFAAAAAALLVVAAPLEGQEIALDQRPWTAAVLRPSGQPVVPLFEGWYPNPDGTRSLCFGYFNLNTEEAVDIPLGPYNFIEPAHLDGRQPTHFNPVPDSGYRRDWCVFTVQVPADFGPVERVVWTLRHRGEMLSVPGHLMPAYVLDEPRSDGRGDVAPLIRFEPGGPAIQGRTGGTFGPVPAAVGVPLELTVWVEHPEQRSWLGWSKHRGPGRVTFSEAELRLSDVPAATTTATFTEPGDYVLRVQAIDATSSFEFYCCWTNGYLEITVRE